MIFSYDDLHIILKLWNLAICEHSSFLIIGEIVFEIKLEVPKFKDYEIVTINQTNRAIMVSN